MSQPEEGRYKSRGRKERTLEQLKVLAMAREKAKLVIAEKTKIKREMKDSDPPPTVSPPPEEEPIEEPLAETPKEVSVPAVESPPPPEPVVPTELPVEHSAPPPQPSMTRDEIQSLIHSTLDERRAPERKYAFMDGLYVKIK